MVATRTEILGEKPDGRQYARVTRRTVRLLDISRQHGEILISDLAAKASASEEFHWTRAGGSREPISAGRLRDYVNFARTLGLFVNGSSREAVRVADNTPSGGLVPAETWAATLSSQALEYLQGPLREDNIVRARNKLGDTVDHLIEEMRDPTISAIAEYLGIVGGRDQEVFRWAMLLYFDGERCPFELRYHPRVARKVIG